MKATLKLEDGREIQVELSDKDVDTIIKPKKTGWERAEIGGYYRYIHISTNIEDGTWADDDRYQEGRYISSYNLALDQIRAIKLWLCIKRWAAEHCEPVTFETVSSRWQRKYGIQWAFVEDDGKYRIISAIQDSTRQFGNVYFDSLEHAEQCIEEFKDELTWYFTECKDRMDG